MRGSGWLLPILALVAWVASVAYPAIAIAAHILGLPRSDVEIRSATQLLLTSFGWAAGVALGAVIVGWVPGRLLGRSLPGRGFVPLAALLLVPICLPAYIVFYAWWQSWPAETAIFKWVVQHQYMQLARQITLYMGLLCWSWPLVSWCVAGSVAATPAEREELLLLDGADWRYRWLDRLRCDFRGLAIGGLLVFLATLSNTTCFDLAEVFTFSNELRAVQALGANARDVMVAGMPAIVIAAAGAACVWVLLGGRPREAATRQRPAHPTTRWLTALIWIVSVLLPVGLFVRSVAGRDYGRQIAHDFVNLYGQSVVNTLALAGVSGAIGAIIATGMSAAWQDHRRWARFIATVMAWSWLALAVMPGTIIGAALEAAYNRDGILRSIYSSPAILVIAHVACFGGVAALLARWTAQREPALLADLRRVDGAQTLLGQIESSWPRLLAAGVATAAVIFVLAIGEIPVTAMVNPPMRAGSGPLALTLLNDMHYQRPQTVMIAALGMIALASLAAFIVAVMWRMLRTISREKVRRAT